MEAAAAAVRLSTERQLSQIAGCRGADDRMRKMRNVAPDTSVHISQQRMTYQSHVVFTVITPQNDI